jgi:lipoprotein-releasing system permease protein
MKLSFLIAKTHLLARPKQTIVAMMGVTFGIGVFIAMVSLMTGLNDFTEELSMTSTPDIRIFNDVEEERKSIVADVNPHGLNLVHHEKPKREQPRIRNAFQIAEIVRSYPTVMGASPQVTSQAFFNYGPVQLNGMISGVDIMEEDNLFDLKSRMKEGNLEALSSVPNIILMGAGLARKLNVRTGDRVLVTTPQGQNLNLKIAGLFQIGLGAVDNIKCYASLETVQRMLEKDPSYVTEINVKLHDFRIANVIAPGMAQAFGYKAEDWQTANATFLLGVKIRNILTYSVSVTLLIVAGFGIYNILNMTIINKMKDIAILKATGFAGKDVRLIFMIQSMAIGLIGSILGLCIGFTLAYLISQAPFDGGEFVTIDRFPVNFKMKYYVVGVIFGVLTTALAGYMPSRKAANVDPIEILRGQ